MLAHAEIVVRAPDRDRPRAAGVVVGGQTLSLALNPFPRSEAAEEALREAGVKTEEQAQAESSPFAGLAALKDKLKP